MTDRRNLELFKTENFLHLGLVVLLGAILYINALDGPFLFDDNVYVLSHPQILEGGSFLSYFTQSFCEGTPQGCPFYRPLVTLFLRMDFILWGENPLGFHLSSLLVHLLVLVLLYRVVVSVFKDKVVALVTTFLFAVHPIHVESVSVISNRTDPPTTFFFLLSFLGFHLYLKSGRKTWGFYFISLGAFVLTVFTKEIGMTLPLILLLYDLLLRRPWAGVKDLFQRWPDYVPFALMGLFYLGVRSMAMGSITVENIYGMPLGFRLMNAVVLVQEYLTLLLFPYPLMIFHEVPQVSGLFDPKFFISVVMIGFLIGFFIWNRKSYPGFLFSGLWFLITLFPVLNVIPIPSPSVMERSAYLPSIGFCLGIGWAGRYLLDRCTSQGTLWGIHGLRGIFLLILIVFSVMTVQRNTVWQDEVLIWEDLYRKVPNESPLGHFNLGREYHIRGELDRAEKEYRLALKYKQKPDPILHQYLAMIYQKKSRSQDAIREYEKAIALGSQKAQVFYNLGLEVLKQGREDEGLGLIQKAIDIDPDYLKAHLQLAMSYANQKEAQKAIVEFHEVIRIDPQEDRSHFRLAVLYDTQGSEEKAREHYLLFLNKAKPHPLMEKMMSHAQNRLHVFEERKPSH